MADDIIEADIESLRTRGNPVGTDLTPMESLIDAQRSIRTGESTPRGSIIIFLDDAGHYHWERRIVGMLAMEAVALLEAVKHDLLNRAAK